ncbi:MAG: hypothetical protein EOP42_14645 [Sphingobacteriaceae bacterium]|nr:MAG: hypothetical protein EOP42_14645 [Sphingobacteriaceae bacterium]
MDTVTDTFLGIELKPLFLEEFKICGIPIPAYINHSEFVLLQFTSIESYLNYVNALKLILFDMKLADPENCKYEIQRSKFFIKHLIEVMRKSFADKYNQ